jgi:hypothetical protein
MGWYVTLMLAGGGLFCTFCAFRNHDWFFENWAARPFVRLLGRRWARLFYIALGIFVMTPGVIRMVRPPAKFAAEHAHWFTCPFGFGLLDAGSTERIRSTAGVVSFREANGKWTEFGLVVTLERFPVLGDPSSLFVDVDGGFRFNERMIAGKSCTGVVMYFDAAYRPCDRVIFSRTPVDSAEFIVMVLDAATSHAFGCKDGLISSFHRRGTPMFANFVK